MTAFSEMKRLAEAASDKNVVALLSQIERLTAERDAAQFRFGNTKHRADTAESEVSRLTAELVEVRAERDKAERRIERLQELGAVKCPMKNDEDLPCPTCGATVEGNDPVHGVCQAGNAFGIEQKQRADTLAAENATFKAALEKLDEMITQWAADQGFPRESSACWRTVRAALSGEQKDEGL